MEKMEIETRLEIAVVVREVRGPVQRGPAAAVALVDLGAVVEEVVELEKGKKGRRDGEREKR